MKRRGLTATSLIFAIVLCALSAAAAVVPSWWFTRGVLNTNATPNDFAALTQGQVKNIASNAAAEMNADLPPMGAGTTITTLVNSFSPTNNYLGVTLGQLKYVAQPFYDRLMAIGYTNAYPWASITTTNDYATANIGQLKYLFAWSIANRSAIGAIAAGGEYSLAMTPDGKLWAWGANDDGQLGDGTENGEVFPVEVADITSCLGQTISNIVSLASGDDFLVAADATGTVWTCGGDDAGQLGRGSVPDTLGRDSFPPSSVSGVGNVVGVAAGIGHTLALRADGTGRGGPTQSAQRRACQAPQPGN